MTQSNGKSTEHNEVGNDGIDDHARDYAIAEDGEVVISERLVDAVVTPAVSASK